MAKRFTDSEKWKKNWFRKLPCDMKVFWVYICDNCNIAGIWDVDFEVASFFTGNEIIESVAFKYMEKQIMVLSPTKWLIKDFVPFQYGNLVPNNNMHRAVLNLLEISGAGQGLTSPKAGDKVKDKVKDNTSKTILNINTKYDFESIWLKYPKRIGKKEAARHFQATVKTDQDWQDIQKALEVYLKTKEVKNGFIQNGSTWFNNWRDYVNYTDPTDDGIPDEWKTKVNDSRR